MAVVTVHAPRGDAAVGVVVFTGTTHVIHDAVASLLATLPHLLADLVESLDGDDQIAVGHRAAGKRGARRLEQERRARVGRRGQDGRRLVLAARPHQSARLARRDARRILEVRLEDLGILHRHDGRPGRDATRMDGAVQSRVERPNLGAVPWCVNATPARP